MIYVTVKEYAALIGKSDKSVYKMIDKEKLITKKGEKQLLVAVDEQFVKLTKRLQKELEMRDAEAAGRASKTKKPPKKSITAKPKIAAKMPKKSVTKKKKINTAPKKTLAFKTVSKKKK